MFRLATKLTILWILLLGVSASLFAQATGTIAGTVTDANGAVVRGAKIVLTNMGSKDARHSTSNGEGFFSISGLIAGDYSVRIEAPGFKGWEQGGIHILPGDRKTVPNISLAVGASAEVITVEASANEVQVVDSGDRASVLTSKNISNLALQGRDVTELIRTLPGFANITGGLSNTAYDNQRTGIYGGSQVQNFTASGIAAGSGAMDVISDGARVIDPGCNCSATQTINSDMVSEVKVSTSAFSAENSTGPVSIQAIGKSGGSDYHGSVYYHFRDAAMNSNDYQFKTLGVDRPDTRYHYPGVNFGGPVKIPGTKFNRNKKLVFWVGYENYKQRTLDMWGGGLVKTNVATLSERAGHLDPTLPDNAANCAALSANTGTKWLSDLNMRCKPVTYAIIKGAFMPVLPDPVTKETSNLSKLIQPGAQAYLNSPMFQRMVPNYKPTALHPYNFVKPLMSHDNGQIFHTRADYSLSDMTKLYVSYNYQTDNMDLNGGSQYYTPGYIYDAGAVYHNRSHTLAGNLVTIFNQNLTNELQANFAYVNIPIDYTTPDKVTYKGLNFPYQLGVGSPYVPALSGIAGVPGIGAPDSSGYYSRKFTPTFSDSLTKVAGTHTLKFGLKYMHVSNKQLSYNPFGAGTNGSISNFAMFQSALANFLTDYVPAGGYSTLTYTPINTGFGQLGGYAEDDWKIAKRLTLTLGLRLDHYGAWTDQSERGNGLAVFSKAFFDKDVAAGVQSLPGVRTHAMDSSIPKSGRDTKPVYVAPRFGLAYDVLGTGKTVLRGGIGAYYYNDSYEGYSQALALANGSRSCKNKNAASLAQVAAGDVAVGMTCSDTNSSLTSITAADATDDKEPLTWTYNFSISQRSFKNSILEVAYSGSQTTNQMNPLQNINYIPIGAFYKGGKTLADVRKLVNDHNNDNSVYDKYRVFTDRYQSINLIRHGAWSNYNSLQVSWNRPMGAFSYGFNYTWSKSMGITGAADPANIHNDYGITGQDRTHVFNATYSYDVGDRFKSHKALNLLLANWGLTGITSIQSGQSFQSASLNYGLTGSLETWAPAAWNPAEKSYDSANNVMLLGTDSYTVMPVLTCKTPKTGATSGQYFNPSCFAVPAVGTTTQRYWFPNVRGPMRWSSDATIAKSFRLKERQRLQFKLMATNFLNHPLTGFDGSTTDTLNAVQGVIQKTVNLGDGTMFPVGKTSTKNGVRIVTLSLKYEF